MSGIKGALALGAAVAVVGYTTTTTSTSTITTEAKSTSPTPTPTPTPTTTTTTMTSSIPAGYTVRNAREFGIMCDGIKDDTAALQNALNALRSYQVLQLPAGTCKYTKQLMIYVKNNVAVVGAGKESTILRAVDPLRSSFIVWGSSYTTLSDFQVYSPNTGDTQRTSDVNSKGFFVSKSSYVTLDGVKANHVAGAGILLVSVKQSKVINSEVLESHADAFHVTGASTDFLFQNNVAIRAGDDCFASIGYGTGVNRNIRIYDNKCYDNLGRYRSGPGGSAVAFEGTNGGQAYRNYGEKTGVAGLRVASQKNWNTTAVSNIDFRDNVLVNVRTNKNIDMPAVFVYTTYQNISNISFSNTTIRDPLTWAGIRLLNYRASSGISIANVNVSDAPITSDGWVKRCMTVEGGNVYAVAKNGVTLNGQGC
jgi:hypothetical protein